MAFSDLTSNQMVTFTNAQSGGFTLNSGQSNVTSNQCMTKNDALTKYNLTASSMSSYASNQLVPKSTWLSAATYYAFNRTLGYDSDSAACNFTYVGVLYSGNASPILGNIMYTDTALTIPFNGVDFWYSFDGNLSGSSYQINSSGQLVAFYDCLF